MASRPWGPRSDVVGQGGVKCIAGALFQVPLVLHTPPAPRTRPVKGRPRLRRPAGPAKAAGASGERGAFPKGRSPPPPSGPSRWVPEAALFGSGAGRGSGRWERPFFGQGAGRAGRRTGGGTPSESACEQELGTASRPGPTTWAGGSPGTGTVSTSGRARSPRGGTRAAPAPGRGLDRL